MIRDQIRQGAWLLVVTAAIALAATGCRTGAPQHGVASTSRPAVFFPVPPDRPRVQFLTALNGADDIEPKKGAFKAFIIGKDTAGLDARGVGRPHGIAVREGVVYVCDTAANRIVRLNLRERTFTSFGTRGIGRLRKPVNLAVDEAGFAFVADTLRQQVVVFGPDDAYVNAFPLPDGGRPVDVAVRGDELYVLDNDKTPQVVVLERRSGKVLRAFGAFGSGSGQLNLPTAVAVGPNGDVVVSDTLNFRVQKYTGDGRLVWERGEAGRRLGQFARPKGLAVGPDGVVYVVETAMELVQMFNAEGQLLMHLGGPGDGTGALMLPASVAVDRTSIPFFQQYVYPGFTVDYLVFVTSQVGARRVSVYAFGSFPEGYVPAEGTIQALPVLPPTTDSFGPDASRESLGKPAEDAPPAAGNRDAGPVPGAPGKAGGK
jgi:sugar lactone lactonase YvrE